MSAPLGPRELWPFLAVLVRPRGQTTTGNEDGMDAVVGLGWLVTPELVVTARGVADVAEEEVAEVVFANELAGARLRRMHVVGGDEQVAVMRLDEAAEPDRMGPRTRPPVTGELCAVATSDNFWPGEPRVLLGRITGMQREDRFTVELDVTLPDYRTAFGSPVLAEDSIVGVVGGFAMNRSVEAFTLGAVLPLFGEAP